MSRSSKSSSISTPQMPQGNAQQMEGARAVTRTLATIADQIEACRAIEDRTESESPATHRRQAFETLALTMTPTTLDDAAELLTLAIMRQETDSECPSAHVALRSAADLLLRLGHGGRFRQLYFSHVELASGSEAAA